MRTKARPAPPFRPPVLRSAQAGVAVLAAATVAAQQAPEESLWAEAVDKPQPPPVPERNRAREFDMRGRRSIPRAARVSISRQQSLRQSVARGRARLRAIDEPDSRSFSANRLPGCPPEGPPATLEFLRRPARFADARPVRLVRVRAVAAEARDPAGADRQRSSRRRMNRRQSTRGRPVRGPAARVPPSGGPGD